MVFGRNTVRSKGIGPLGIGLKIDPQQFLSGLRIELSAKTIYLGEQLRNIEGKIIQV